MVITWWYSDSSINPQPLASEGPMVMIAASDCGRVLYSVLCSPDFKLLLTNYSKLYTKNDNFSFTGCGKRKGQPAEPAAVCARFWQPSRLHVHHWMLAAGCLTLPPVSSGQWLLAPDPQSEHQDCVWIWNSAVLVTSSVLQVCKTGVVKP